MLTGSADQLEVKALLKILKKTGVRKGDTLIMDIFFVGVLTKEGVQVQFQNSSGGIIQYKKRRNPIYRLLYRRLPKLVWMEPNFPVEVYCPTLQGAQDFLLLHAKFKVVVTDKLVTFQTASDWPLIPVMTEEKGEMTFEDLKLNGQ